MKRIVLGFTGTRTPLLLPQRHALGLYLAERQAAGAWCLHHGDCVGADAMAHKMAESITMHIVIHPPRLPDFRAYCVGDEMREEKPYWARNRDIVDACDELVACPKAGTGLADWRRSGTWYTVQHAHKVGKPVRIIYPDGSSIGAESAA